MHNIYIYKTSFGVRIKNTVRSPNLDQLMPIYKTSILEDLCQKTYGNVWLAKLVATLLLAPKDDGSVQLTLLGLYRRL